MTFSDWWPTRWSFGFGTRWLEPIFIPIAVSAWEESAKQEREQIAAWHAREGWLLDEADVAGAIRSGAHMKTPNV